MSGNKGEVSYLIILLFSLIVLVLLLLLSVRINELIKEQAKAGECKASVAILSKLGSYGKVRDSPLACPVNRRTLTKEEEIFPIIAREMATLWNNFGAGQLELFPAQDDVFCVLGSHITFAGMNKEVKGLLPYLAEHAYQRKTYLEYLTGLRFSSAQKAAMQSPEMQALDKIDTTKPFGILFVYSKDAKLTKQEGTVMGLGVGSVIGVVAGVVTLFYFPPAGLSVLGYTLITPLTIGVAKVAATTAFTALAGSATGYLFGYDESAEWDARIVALPFTVEEINKLPCTYWPVPVQ